MSRFCSFASSLISFIFLIWQQAYSRSHEETLRSDINQCYQCFQYTSSSERTSRFVNNCKIILIHIHKIGIIIMILQINFAIIISIFFFTLRLVSTGILDKTILIASSPRCTVFWLGIVKVNEENDIGAILPFFKMRAQP